MHIEKTPIPDLIVIEPRVFNDSRGYFFEPYNQQVFDKHVGPVRFVQDNESKSDYGVLRGLHFQKPPFAQAKLIRCIKGKVLDVAVDVRQKSPTFAQHFSIILSDENKKQLFVPRGFAHAFLVVSHEAIVGYKVDNFYAPEHDSGIIWNDPALNIKWNIAETDLIISSKDQALKPLNEINTEFIYLPQ